MGRPLLWRAGRKFSLRDFVLENAPALGGDVEAQLSAGIVSFKANVAAARSDVVKAEGSLPLQLRKLETGYAFNTDGPLAANLSFPSIFLAKLPAYISRGLSRAEF